jgi:hypothetical protein
VSNILDLLDIKVSPTAADALVKPEPKPKPAKPEPDTPKASIEEAAHALATALEADTGRRKSLAHWKPVVGKALGMSRLYKKRYDAVLDKGVALGLWTIDRDSGSYPFLVRIVPEPEPEPEPEDPEVTASREERARWDAQRVLAPPPPKDPPANWDPPGFLDCGHWTWQKVRKTEEECSDSEKKRLSDVQSVKPYKMARVHSQEECLYCQEGRSANSYQHQKGKFRTPVPEKQRRTVEREQGQGWPGLCCDENGLYIGGIVNNCRYVNPKGPHCVVHANRKRTN